jgi:hypothetical protein
MRINLPDNNEQKQDKIARLFLQVSKFEADKSGNEYAVGTDITGQIPGELKIRLTTVEERMTDRPKENKQKVSAQYSQSKTGRDSIKDKSNAKATVLAFDDLIATDKTGKKFRAHWAKTLSSADKPSKILLAPVAHIELQQQTNETRSKAYIETIVKDVNLSELKSKRSLDKAFVDAFSTKDISGNPQRPFAVMNLRHNDQPVLILLPRLYPETSAKKIKDEQGNTKTIQSPLSATTSVKNILSGQRQGQNTRETFALDVFRATYAALSKLDNVKIFSEGKNREYVEKIFKGIKDGKIEARLSSGISYNFGPASAQTYLEDADKKHLSVFNIEKKVGDKDKSFERTVNGYAPVVVALQQFQDGSHYVVNAVSNIPYPKTKALNEIDLSTSNETKMLENFDTPDLLGEKTVSKTKRKKPAADVQQTAETTPPTP